MEVSVRELRVLCRVVTYNPDNQSILLVRNRDQKWWCAPGGGWDYAHETLIECAKREALEETGIQVNVTRLLYIQTLYVKKQEGVWLEQFWLAEPVGDTEPPRGHIDYHGVVDEARWFNRNGIQAVVVYPEALKNTFWDVIHEVLKDEDRYLGHFTL